MAKRRVNPGVVTTTYTREQLARQTELNRRWIEILKGVAGLVRSLERKRVAGMTAAERKAHEALLLRARKQLLRAVDDVMPILDAVVFTTEIGKADH